MFYVRSKDEFQPETKGVSKRAKEKTLHKTGSLCNKLKDELGINSGIDSSFPATLNR